MTEIYLDNCTATKPSDSALQRAMIYFSENYGSTLAPHQKGLDLSQDAAKYYEEIYAFFNAQEEANFVFTSSGAEAVSQVYHSVKKSCVEKEGKNHFIAKVTDEAASIYALSSLEQDACITTLAPVGHHGYMTVETLEKLCTIKTCLISCSYACALTGVIQPVEEIIDFTKERNILVHLDITHCVGKLALDCSALDADYITFNGQQFHGLSGTGGLFAKSTAPLYPLIHGENEERARRGGVLIMPLLASFAQTLQEAKANEMFYCTEVSRLRDMFERELVARCPGTQVLFQNEERLPHISCIAFPGIKSELLLFALHKKNLYASMGGGSFQHIENVLLASGISKPTAQCALSFGLSKDTQEQEIEQALDVIQSVHKRLIKASRVYFS